MANAHPIHPFNDKQKLYSNPEAISLLLLLCNEFGVGQVDPVYANDWDYAPPIAMRERIGFKLPIIEQIGPKNELDKALLQWQLDEDAVAVFHHPSMDSKDQFHIVAIMKSIAHVNKRFDSLTTKHERG